MTKERFEQILDKVANEIPLTTTMKDPMLSWSQRWNRLRKDINDELNLENN